MPQLIMKSRRNIRPIDRAALFYIVGVERMIFQLHETKLWLFDVAFQMKIQIKHSIPHANHHRFSIMNNIIWIVGWMHFSTRHSSIFKCLDLVSHFVQKAFILPIYRNIFSALFSLFRFIHINWNMCRERWLDRKKPPTKIPDNTFYERQRWNSHNFSTHYSSCSKIETKKKKIDVSWMHWRCGVKMRIVINHRIFDKL